MSGYEKSPDYGGPEYTKRDWAIVIVLFMLLSAAPAACMLLKRDATSEADQAASSEAGDSP